MPNNGFLSRFVGERGSGSGPDEALDSSSHVYDSNRTLSKSNGMRRDREKETRRRPTRPRNEINKRKLSIGVALESRKKKNKNLREGVSNVQLVKIKELVIV